MSEKKTYRSKSVYFDIARHYEPSPQIRELIQLANPKNREKLKQIAQGLVISLPEEVREHLPTEDELRKYRLQRSFFLNPFTQAGEKSDHGIWHGVATETLAGDIAVAANYNPEASQVPEDLISLKESMIAASLHDSQGLGVFDIVERAFFTQRHARKAAEKVPLLLKKMGVQDEIASEGTALIADMIRYHDMPESPMDENPHIQVLKLADALGMVRFVLHPKRWKGVQNIALQTVQDKLFDYTPLDSRIASLKETFIPIAIALYAFGESYGRELKGTMSFRRRIRGDSQFEGMLKAAKELGMIRQDKH